MTRDSSIVRHLLHSFGDRKESCAPQDEPRKNELVLALEKAGVPLQRALRAVIISGVLCGTVEVWLGWRAATLSVVGVAAWGCLWLRRRARRRADELERDLPAFLTTIASSVRAGIDPLSALIQAEKFFTPPSVLGAGITTLKGELARGVDEERLIGSFMGGLSSADLELFKRCMLLSRRHGASIAEPLHRVVRVVRQRQSFRRKTRAALAMHRLSAIGIACCAIVIAGIQVAMNLPGIELAWRSKAGSTCLAIGLVFIVVGVGWMMSMGREEKL